VGLPNARAQIKLPRKALVSSEGLNVACYALHRNSVLNFLPSVDSITIVWEAVFNFKESVSDGTEKSGRGITLH
jgi:hypothetical protein